MLFRRTLPLAILLFILTLKATGYGQPVFTGTEIFPSEEFAARRAKVLAEIGDAVAILQGTTERPGEQPLPTEQSVLLPDRRDRASSDRRPRRTCEENHDLSSAVHRTPRPADVWTRSASGRRRCPDARSGRRPGSRRVRKAPAGSASRRAGDLHSDAA